MITITLASLILFGSALAASAFEARSGGRADSQGAPRTSHELLGAWRSVGWSPIVTRGQLVGDTPADYYRALAKKRLRLLAARERRIVRLLYVLHHRHRATRPHVDACLSELIQRESRWNVHATNPSTGAYGLPQALPGSKMASAGADWRDNPNTQIRWMLGYVRKYGGSCGALAFQKANGYY